MRAGMIAHMIGAQADPFDQRHQVPGIDRLVVDRRLATDPVQAVTGGDLPGAYWCSIVSGG
ncbi:MAG: hypothetical protein WB611_26785 [Stellaceae bacterium]